MTMVGRSRGIPAGDKGWLPPPGCPVSGLASANTMTSGEEFLDREVEVWESLRSMSDVWRKGEKRGMFGQVHLDLSPFISFLETLVCQGMLYGTPGVLCQLFLSGGHKVPRCYLLPDNLPI